MTDKQSIGIRVIITLLLLVGLFYMPTPAFSQQTANIQDLVHNGGFEAGFEARFEARIEARLRPDMAAGLYMGREAWSRA